MLAFTRCNKLDLLVNMWTTFSSGPLSANSQGNYVTFYSLNAHQLIANLACRVVLVRLSGAVVALKQDGCYNWANGVRGVGFYL